MSDASTLFDFSKLRDVDKQSQSNTDQLQTLLEQNNLYRKKLPDGPKSLLRAVSDTLYFTSHYCDQIQQFLFKQLSHLITTDKLPPRLSMFRGNSMLLKDYTSSPHLSGFDKINLELVSSLFKVRIVVYSATEDNYLNAIIVNNFHEKTIELVRGKNNHYEPVYSKRHMDKIGVAQNVILNIIDQVAEGKSSTSASMKDLNGDSYINFDYLKWLSTNRQESSLNQFRITRGHHKKSFSDTFSKLLETKDDQQMKLYDMFTNTKPPEDFLKLLRQRKDTAGSDFSINATLDFMDEPWSENPNKTKDTSVRQYHMNTSHLPSSSRTPSIKEDATFSQGLRSRTSVQNPTGYFQDNVNISGIEKLEDNAMRDTSMMSPIHFIRTPPPGLTPTRYLQKSFTYSETGNPISNSELLNSSPTFQRNDGGGQTPNSVYGQRSPARHGFSAFSGQDISPQHRPGAVNNLYSKRTGNLENLLIPVSTDAAFQQGAGFGQGELMEQLSASKEKKKPIILDESKERYTGRLKFFDEAKNYGFIIMDDDGSDIFVHMDDLMKANIPKETLRTIKNGNMLRLSFCCMSYIGKYKKSRKAIEIIILE